MNQDDHVTRSKTPVEAVGRDPRKATSGMPLVTANIEPSKRSLRWVAISVFSIFSAINYLDRQLLAALAPTIRSAFHLTNAQYGQLVSAFSFVYALLTPFAGLFVDAVGLNRGALVALSTWSIFSAATGLVPSLTLLFAARMALGAAESSGIPCATKASASYLSSRELGLATAVHSIGISVGTISAPLLVAAMASTGDWRSPFLVCGLAGLLWMPLWLWTSRRIRPLHSTRAAAAQPIGILMRKRSLWGVALASALVMTVYILWANWTTLYLVQERHLSPIDANRYFAWIPAIFATLGGLFGGWLGLRSIRESSDGVWPRMRLSMRLAPILLVTAVVPLVHSTALAIAAASMGVFGSMSILTNLQVIPIDLFGPGRAAFTSSVLTCSFALMQTLVSPAIGSIVDNVGFLPVCILMSVLPLLGVGVLRLSLRDEAKISVAAFAGKEG